jgi:hypothetical protein
MTRVIVLAQGTRQINLEYVESASKYYPRLIENYKSQTPPTAFNC